MAKPDGKKAEVVDLYGRGYSLKTVSAMAETPIRTVTRWLKEAEGELPQLGILTRRRLRFMIDREDDFDKLMRLMSVAARYPDVVDENPKTEVGHLI